MTQLGSNPDGAILTATVTITRKETGLQETVLVRGYVTREQARILGLVIEPQPPEMEDAGPRNVGA